MKTSIPQERQNPMIQPASMNLPRDEFSQHINFLVVYSNSVSSNHNDDILTMTELLVNSIFNHFNNLSINEKSGLIDAATSEALKILDPETRNLCLSYIACGNESLSYSVLPKFFF